LIKTIRFRNTHIAEVKLVLKYEFGKLLFVGKELNLPTEKGYTKGTYFDV
jgi:hypothetical protein